MPGAMLRKLEQHCASNESGEFIAKWEQNVLRVHLHQGLVAWVAEEPSQSERSRTLLRALQLDKSTFEAVAEERRRTQSSLGAAIEQLGLATIDEIADAFFTYMRGSLSSSLVGRARAGSAEFLKRSDSTDDYDARFAFRLETLMPERIRRTQPLPNLASMPTLFRGLLPELTNVVRAPMSPLPPCPADFAVLRSASTLRVGVELVRDEGIWFEGNRSMLLAPIVHAVTTHIRSPLLARRKVLIPETHAENADTFRVFAERYPDLLAVAERGSQGPQGIFRDPIAQSAVACAVEAGFPADCDDVLLGIGDHWVFGKQRASGAAWFAISRADPQAIGWNMLRSLE